MLRTKPIHLPRHLRAKPDKTSRYYDGCYAQRHPNSYYGDESGVDIVLAMLDTARAALAPWDGRKSPLPIEAAAAIKDAFESLSDIDSHLPKLTMWCVWTEYLPGKDGRRWSDSQPVWSAHLTKEAANQWLPLWREKLKHQSDYGWHVSLHECSIRDVLDPEVPAPKEII